MGHRFLSGWSASEWISGARGRLRSGGVKPSVWRRFAPWAIGVLSAGTSTGCMWTVTPRDVLDMNPDLVVVPVCARPWFAQKDTMMWVRNFQTQLLVTDNDPAWMRIRSKYAEVLFLYDPNAPPESVELLGPDRRDVQCPRNPSVLPRLCPDNIGLSCDPLGFGA